MQLGATTEEESCREAWEGAGPHSPASRLPMRPKNCWGRGLRAILCRKCSRGSGSSSCGTTAPALSADPHPAAGLRAPGGSALHCPPGPTPAGPAGWAAAAGAHLPLVAVGPVGPVAEVVGGAHLLGQRLRRGQEQHGESQREPHRRLDVLRGRGWSTGTPSPGGASGRGHPRPGVCAHTALHTHTPVHTRVHTPSHTQGTRT